MSRVNAVVGAYPHTDALFAKPIELSTGQQMVTRRYTDIAGGAAAVAARQVREIRGFDFDIAELPLVNYLSSKECGAKYTALPVFLTRRFVQNMLIVNREIVSKPADLEGKRVGLIYYGHTDSTWLRGILAEQYGVDLSAIEWITSAEEQVARAVLPDNVIHIPRTSIDDMLRNGEVVAQIIGPRHLDGSAFESHIGPLWANSDDVDREWFETTGVLPILHTVVVKDSLLEAVPNLAQEVYTAFVAAKDQALKAIQSGRSLGSDDMIRARSSGFPTGSYPDPSRPYLDADPIPYGIEPNRINLEMLIRMAREMHIMAWSPQAEDIFLAVE